MGKWYNKEVSPIAIKIKEQLGEQEWNKQNMDYYLRIALSIEKLGRREYCVDCEIYKFNMVAFFNQLEKLEAIDIDKNSNKFLDIKKEYFNQIEGHLLNNHGFKYAWLLKLIGIGIGLITGLLIMLVFFNFNFIAFLVFLSIGYLIGLLLINWYKTIGKLLE